MTSTIKIKKCNTAFENQANKLSMLIPLRPISHLFAIHWPTWILTWTLAVSHCCATDCQQPARWSRTWLLQVPFQQMSDHPVRLNATVVPGNLAKSQFYCERELNVKRWHIPIQASTPLLNVNWPILKNTWTIWRVSFILGTKRCLKLFSAALIHYCWKLIS